MFLYNVTITVNKEIADEWLNWMRRQHIPDVMSTGQFISYRLNRLLEHEHDDSEIFTVQYLVRDRLHLLRYLEEFAPDLQREHRARYEGKFAAFRTVMAVVDHNERGLGD